MKKAFIGAIALMMVATAASAAKKEKTPEIDPASAMTALTMLAASVAVLRGRRSKEK